MTTQSCSKTYIMTFEVNRKCHSRNTMVQLSIPNSTNP